MEEVRNELVSRHKALTDHLPNVTTAKPDERLTAVSKHIHLCKDVFDCAKKVDRLEEANGNISMETLAPIVYMYKFAYNHFDFLKDLPAVLGSILLAGARLKDYAVKHYKERTAEVDECISVLDSMQDRILKHLEQSRR